MDQRVISLTMVYASDVADDAVIFSLTTFYVDTEVSLIVVDKTKPTLPTISRLGDTIAACCYSAEVVATGNSVYVDTDPAGTA